MSGVTVKITMKELWKKKKTNPFPSVTYTLVEQAGISKQETLGERTVFCDNVKKN